MKGLALVETRNLTRAYGSFKALDNLNLQVEAGETFALLGPNGAGKSTLMKMLTTLLPPSSGDAFIDGFSIRKQPEQVRRIVPLVYRFLSFWSPMPVGTFLYRQWLKSAPADVE